MKVRFLCGCETANVEARENLKSMDAVMYDEEGMLVCKAHKQRRVGWRSHGRNWKLARLTPLELEGFVVFNEIPREQSVEVHSPRSVNMRDNRDPELVYAGRVFLPESNGHITMRAVPEIRISAWDRAQHADAVRERLDLKDRTGWPTIDAFTQQPRKERHG